VCGLCVCCACVCVNPRPCSQDRLTVAPTSSVVKCVWEVFISVSGMLFLSCVCVCVGVGGVVPCPCVCVRDLLIFSQDRRTVKPGEAGKSIFHTKPPSD